MANSAPEEDPQALLQRVAQAYSAMTSYQDNGRVALVNGDDPPFQIDFATLYKRPSLFRFEFSRPHPYAPLRHIVSKYVVGFDGTAAYSRNERYQRAPQLETRKDLQSAIAGATGISSGSAHSISCLLLPEVSGFSILDLVEVRMHEMTQIDGIPCYRVVGNSPRGGEWDCTIERDSLLIRRIKTRFGEYPNEEYLENIRVDRPLDDRLFAATRS